MNERMTMLNLLWLVPALPLPAFLCCALCGSRLPRAAGVD